VAVVVWTVAAALLFSSLLAATAAANLRGRRLAVWLKRHDRCCYIPIWTFFAPNPAVMDTRLLWREQQRDGTIGSWQELVPPRSGLRRSVWYPDKRARKAVNDCGPMIARTLARSTHPVLPMLSLPYLMIAQHVVGQPAAAVGTARQFMVVRTQGSDESSGTLEALFISGWHTLAPSTTPDHAAPSARPRRRRLASIA
jgi:hypothetical protein